MSTSVNRASDALGMGPSAGYSLISMITVVCIFTVSICMSSMHAVVFIRNIHMHIYVVINLLILYFWIKLIIKRPKYLITIEIRSLHVLIRISVHTSTNAYRDARHQPTSKQRRSPYNPYKLANRMLFPNYSGRLRATLERVLGVQDPVRDECSTNVPIGGLVYFIVNPLIGVGVSDYSSTTRPRCVLGRGVRLLAAMVKMTLVGLSLYGTLIVSCDC